MPRCRTFYKAQSDPNNPQAQFYKPATMTFRVVATASQKAAAQRALQDLNSNTPFELVAAQYSIDPSKDAGGLISPLQRGRSPLSQTPALEATLFNMQVGQTVGPVNFNKGWWIFRCEDKTLGQALPFRQHQGRGGPGRADRQRDEDQRADDREEVPGVRARLQPSAVLGAV